MVVDQQECIKLQFNLSGGQCQMFPSVPRHIPINVWTYTENFFKLIWMKLSNSGNNYATVSYASHTKKIFIASYNISFSFKFKVKQHK